MQHAKQSLCCTAISWTCSTQPSVSNIVMWRRRLSSSAQRRQQQRTPGSQREIGGQVGGCMRAKSLPAHDDQGSQQGAGIEHMQSATGHGREIDGAARGTEHSALWSVSSLLACAATTCPWHAQHRQQQQADDVDGEASHCGSQSSSDIGFRQTLVCVALWICVGPLASALALVETRRVQLYAWRLDRLRLGR